MTNQTQRGKYFWLTASAVLIVILFVVSIPIRNTLSGRFIKNGDAFLSEKKFVSAVLEYNKAKVLSKKFSPDSKIEIVKKAETNLLTIESELITKNAQQDISRISEAKEMPEDEVDAVKKAKKMIEDGFYQQSIILLTTALEMDKLYKDAWVYMGIANLCGANDSQVSKEGRDFYNTKAREAFNKVLELDPGNETAKRYFKG